MSEVECHSTPPSRSGYAIKVQNQRDQPTDLRTATLSLPTKANHFCKLATVLRNSRREKEEGDYYYEDRSALHTISFPLAPVLRSLVSRGQKLFLEW